MLPELRGAQSEKFNKLPYADRSIILKIELKLRLDMIKAREEFRHKLSSTSLNYRFFEQAKIDYYQIYHKYQELCDD